MHETVAYFVQKKPIGCVLLKRVPYFVRFSVSEITKWATRRVEFSVLKISFWRKSVLNLRSKDDTRLNHFVFNVMRSGYISRVWKNRLKVLSLSFLRFFHISIGCYEKDPHIYFDFGHFIHIWYLFISHEHIWHCAHVLYWHRRESEFFLWRSLTFSERVWLKRDSTWA